MINVNNSNRQVKLIQNAFGKQYHSAATYKSSQHAFKYVNQYTNNHTLIILNLDQTIYELIGDVCLLTLRTKLLRTKAHTLSIGGERRNSSIGIQHSIKITERVQRKCIKKHVLASPTSVLSTYLQVWRVISQLTHEVLNHRVSASAYFLTAEVSGSFFNFRAKIDASC